jgi:predicted DNA-binding WGR domain protein
MKKYFEYTDEVSNKFWEINLKKNQMIITFGRIGIKNPVSQLRKFDSNEEAKKYAERKIKEKINKGYLEKNSKTE